MLCPLCKDLVLLEFECVSGHNLDLMNKAMRSFPPDLSIISLPSLRGGVATIVVPISDLYFHPCGLWCVLWLSGKIYWQRDAHQMQFYSLQSRDHYNEIIQYLPLIPRLIYYFYCSLPTLCVWKRPRFLLFPALWLSMSVHFCSSPTSVSFSLIESWNSEASCPSLEQLSYAMIACCVPRIFGEEHRVKRHSHHPTPRCGTVHFLWY